MPVNSALPPVQPTASVSKGGVGLASLIVGIVGLVFAVIPGLCFIAFIPAAVALVLGIVALAKRHPHRGRALSGVIIGAVALFAAILVSLFVLMAALVAPGGPFSDTPAVDVMTSQVATQVKAELA